MLLSLQGALEAALRQRRFALETRPFTPHVTLVRRIDRALAVEPFPPVAWRVSDFVLARSQPGTGRYEIIDRRALGN
jgi:2'-5' RNA ligase